MSKSEMKRLAIMTQGEIKNLNVLALLVTQNEGRKKEVNIAQVKEIIRILGEMIHTNPEIIGLMVKVGKKK
jgi:hypothetical protein